MAEVSFSAPWCGQV